MQISVGQLLKFRGYSMFVTEVKEVKCTRRGKDVFPRENYLRTWVRPHLSARVFSPAPIIEEFSREDIIRETYTEIVLRPLTDDQPTHEILVGWKTLVVKENKDGNEQAGTTQDVDKGSASTTEGAGDGDENRESTGEAGAGSPSQTLDGDG